MKEQTNNVKEILSSYLCFGCGACSVVCATQAITMKYDNIGRLQPEINEDKCTNCGLCKKHCPSLDLKGIQLPTANDPYVGDVRNVYIGKSTDERIFRNSQSGGLVTAILRYLFDTNKIDGAIVCRVDYAQEYLPKAVVITKAEDLYVCQKSSYVPVDMVSALKNLGDLHSVAVVGTGCHIQGFRALSNFKKEYQDKIKYSLGLICDRTLSKTITEVLEEDIYKGEKKKIIWRDKSKNYKNPRLLIKTEDGKEHEEPQWKRHALKDLFTNPRCRICFDKLNVHSDIVLGDPWGMNNVDWEKGESLIITRTDNGENIIEEMKGCDWIDLKKASLDEVILGQHILLRKIMVSAAVSVYQDHNWQIPVYFSHLQLSCQQGFRKELEEKIHNYIVNSNKEKKELISQARAMLWKRKWVILGKKILYPFYVINKILLNK